MIFNLPLILFQKIAYWFFVTVIDPVWSNPIWDTVNGYFDSITTGFYENFVPLFSFLDTIINVDLLFKLVIAIFTAELLFLTIRLVVRLLKRVRIVG